MAVLRMGLTLKYVLSHVLFLNDTVDGQDVDEEKSLLIFNMVTPYYF
jgi:hypothetical protein